MYLDVDECLGSRQFINSSIFSSSLETPLSIESLNISHEKADCKNTIGSYKFNCIMGYRKTHGEVCLGIQFIAHKSI